MGFYQTLHTTDRKMTYFYGARALNEVFYLEDFLQIEKDFPNFTFHLALDRPDPAADAAGVKYTPGFVHQVIYETYLKNHEAPEDIEYYMCGPGPMFESCREDARRSRRSGSELDVRQLRRIRHTLKLVNDFDIFENSCKATAEQEFFY